MKEKDIVLVGKILKSYGLKGEVKVNVFYESLSEFLFFKEFYVYLSNGGTKKLKVTNQRFGGGHTLIFKFEGIDSKELAGELCGLDLYVKKDILPKPKEKEYYFFQLEGLEVRDEIKGRIGKLTYIYKNPAQDIFEIRDEEGKEILLPAVSEFIKKIDLREGEIVVNLPKGLIEEEFGE